MSKRKGKKIESVPYEKKMVVSVQEAAQHTGLSERYIATLTRQPECNFIMFPPTRGRKTMIIREKFESYLQSIMPK